MSHRYFFPRALFVLGICLAFNPLFARVINVPGDSLTIQSGINGAQEGDTVLVRPGTYRENVRISDKNLVLGSLILTTGLPAYIDSTIIDGTDNGSVVTIRDTISAATVVTGFTIRNGTANFGGGLYLNFASPTLERLLIFNNHALRDGGGIYCTNNSAPRLNHITVTADTADRGNGGLHTFNSTAVINNSILWGNVSTANTAGWTVTYSDIQRGYAGQGNINVDPLFIDPGNLNFHIQENSPCVDAGDPNSPQDPDETRTDIGAFYFHQEPAPRIVVEPDSLRFGDVPVNQELELPVIITNLGNADLVVQQPTTDGEPFYADRNEWEQATVEPGDTLEVIALFIPVEMGDFAGQLTIASNDADNDTMIVALLGRGLRPIIAVAPDPLDFSDLIIGDSRELPLLIHNIGNTELNVTAAVIEGDMFTLEFAGEFSVNPGDSAELRVTFSPREAGNYEGMVTITSNDPGDPEVAVRVLGLGRERMIAELGVFDTEGQARGLALVGSWVLAADGQEGLRIIDFTDPENPNELGNCETPGNARSIAVVDSQAIISDEEGGLRAIDFSDPGNPREVWSFDTPGSAYGAAVKAPYAFVADYNAGLRVVDISNPEDIHEAAHLETRGNARAVVTAGNYAYIAEEAGGLSVVLISDPENPREAGRLETPGTAYDVVVRGTYAFVADGGEGLCVIDVSAPDNPRIAAAHDTPGSASGIALGGDLIYLADSTSGLQVIDISNLDNPSLVSSSDTPGEACGVALRGDVCGIADGESGVRYLSISDIAQYPRALVSPDTLDFGLVLTGHSAELTATLSNQGNWTLNITEAMVDGDNFAVDLNDVVALEPGESYDLAVTFEPQEGGDLAGTLTVITDDPYEPRKSVSLVGRGDAFDIIEESGSLLEFFAGTEDGCAYDNWVSHISEGIARVGYNDYGPPELDRQTNGFGAFVMIDSLPNPGQIIADWYNIFAYLFQDEIDSARTVLARSSFRDSYQMVHLEDGEKDYILLREILNDNYFDDNGTQDEADDVRGSFDLGWGLYIFDLDSRTPNVIIEVPHCEDDYLAPFTGIDAFFTIGAGAMFVAGAGREVVWTRQGNYTNGRSLSDPTRIPNNAFHQAHKAAVDLIDQEFVLQIHSYDSDAHPELNTIELSTRLDYYPNRPVLDFENRVDLVSLTPEFPIAANSIGHSDHDSMRVDEYYAVWYDLDFLGQYRYQNRLDISNDVTMFAATANQQMNYSLAGHDSLRDDEPWLHIEQDEFPNVITENILDFYHFGGRVTYANYSHAVEFYHPMYVAINDYFHHQTLRNVPEDFQTIQAAIDLAVYGDTVLVQPGIYQENINFKSKNIIVGSLFLTTGDPAYIDSTIIDGGNNGSVVRFDSGENNDARLTGFTIRGGSGSIDAEQDISGGGIHCHEASPRLTYLKIIGNTAWYAAGIYCELGADAIIDHCLITGNTASIAGGGIDCYEASPTISSCTITGNEALRGGGIYLYDGCKVTLENSILRGNIPQEVIFSVNGIPDTLTFLYSNVGAQEPRDMTRGNGAVIWGDGNNNFDPQFVSPENGDFSLSEGSPCQDAGDPAAQADPDNTWIDMGAVYSPHERQELPRISINSAAFDFGIAEVGQSASLRLQIRNIGYSVLTVSGLVLSGDNADDFAREFEQEFTIDPGGIQNVPLTFTPNGAGERRANLTIASTDPGHREMDVELTGIGLAREDRHFWVVPDDFATIQNAINASAEGDTVLVRPGVYGESIDFLGKELFLSSQFLLDADPAHIIETVVEGDNSGGVVSFISGEGADAVISGFTLRGGQDGVYCAASSPTIRYCIINANSAVNAGGAGVYSRTGASPQLVNCSVVGNSARWGGGIFIRGGAGVALTNCIVWANNPNAVYASGTGAPNQLTVNYSDIEGGQQGIIANNNCQITWGNGNLDVDPLFIDLESGDFHLSEDSPCVNAGDEASPPDPDTTRTDMGALFFDTRIPRIVVSPDTLDFGAVQLEQSVELGLTIRNDGIVDLTVSNIVVEGEFFSIEFEGQFVLQPDSSRVTMVSFTPERRGNFAGTITIASNDPRRSELLIPLHGLGENTPPGIANAIADRNFAEDSGPWEIADLDAVFRDPEGDALTFSVEAPEPLTAAIDAETHILTLDCPENFNTRGLEIQVTASDNPVRRVSMIIQTPRLAGGQASRDETLYPNRQVMSIFNNEFQDAKISAADLPASPNPRRDGTVEDDFTVVITPVNDEPYWVEPPEAFSFTEGQLAQFTIQANDVDIEFEGDRLSLSMLDDDGLIRRGAGFRDNGNRSGTFLWQTDRDDEGVWTPTFQVADQNNDTALVTLRLNIIDTNHPPEVRFEIFDKEFDEDTGPWAIADLDTVFEDEDGDELNFTVNAPEPLAAVINAQTKVLTIDSPENFNGADFEISITADDGDNRLRLIRSLNSTAQNPLSEISRRRQIASFSSTGIRADGAAKARASLAGQPGPVRRDEAVENTFMLTIAPVNDAPVWIDYPREQIIAAEGDTVRFGLSASDIERDRLAFSMRNANLPQAARVIDNGDGTGLFQWPTDFESAGDYFATLCVSDGADTVGVQLQITVRNVNRPPLAVGNIPDAVYNEDCGRVVICNLTQYFRDPDREALNYFVAGADQRLGMGTEGSNLFINPQAHFNLPNPTPITVIAVDPWFASVQQQFNLTVRAINYPPSGFVLLAPADGERIGEGSYRVEFRWEASRDVDFEDTLTYAFYQRIIYMQIDTTFVRRGLVEASLVLPIDSLFRALGIVSEQLIRVPMSWWVEATDGRLTTRSNDRWELVVDAPQLVSNHNEPPREFQLGAIYPNPFNMEVTVEFTLPRASWVAVRIYNLSGREVAMPVNEELDAGRHTANWSAKGFTSGIYVVRMEAPGETFIRPVALVR